jgi:hypothetical protein
VAEVSHASVTYRGREVTNPIARKLVIVVAVVAASAVLPLSLLWLALLGTATLPIHLVKQAIDGKGFQDTPGHYNVPAWAIVLALSTMSAGALAWLLA